MTLDHDRITAILTGMSYLASGMSLGVVVRLLGPTYHTKVTAPLGVIGFFFLCSVGLLWRGVTLLFPGRLVDTAGMSMVAPMTGLIVLGLCVFILDLIMGDRSPPPLFGKYFGWAIRRRVEERELIEQAFAMNPAMHVAAPPDAQITRTGRRVRVVVMSIGVIVILGMLGLLAASAV